VLALTAIKAITEMKTGDEIDKENFDSIYGVLFFGVPNQRIRIEHWLPMVKGQPNENLARNLGPDSTYLRELHEKNLAAFTFPGSEIVSTYETERTRVAKVRISIYLPLSLLTLAHIGRGAWTMGTDWKL
jgi:hypothetical protein